MIEPMALSDLPHSYKTILLRKNNGEEIFIKYSSGKIIPAVIIYQNTCFVHKTGSYSAQASHLYIETPAVYILDRIQE